MELPPKPDGFDEYLDALVAADVPLFPVGRLLDALAAKERGAPLFPNERLEAKLMEAAGLPAQVAGPTEYVSNAPDFYRVGGDGRKRYIIDATGPIEEPSR